MRISDHGLCFESAKVTYIVSGKISCFGCNRLFCDVAKVTQSNSAVSVEILYVYLANEKSMVQCFYK